MLSGNPHSLGKAAPRSQLAVPRCSQRPRLGLSGVFFYVYGAGCIRLLTCLGIPNGGWLSKSLLGAQPSLGSFCWSPEPHLVAYRDKRRPTHLLLRAGSSENAGCVKLWPREEWREVCELCFQPARRASPWGRGLSARWLTRGLSPCFLCCATG